MAMLSRDVPKGFNITLNRKFTLVAFRKLRVGAKPAHLGDEIDRQFAICLDASQPQRVILRQHTKSLESGVILRETIVIQPGIVMLPVGVMLKYLAVTSEEEFSVKECKLPIGKEWISGFRLTTARASISIRQTGWKPYPELISEPIEPEITPSRGRWDHKDWEDIAARYSRGEGFTALAKATGVPATTIHGRLRALGVTFNHRKLQEVQ